MGVAFPAARHMPVARSAHSATFFGSDSPSEEIGSIMVFMGSASFSVPLELALWSAVEITAEIA